MNRTLVASLLGLAGTLCWMAITAGLLNGQIGWFVAMALYMLSGLAWWVPVGREGRRGRRDNE